MPRPVEALPCGSRSTSSTLCAAARTVARLMAVVVLPTPPFWLAKAMTRGLARSGRCAVRTDLADSEDGGNGVGPTREPLHPHDPGTGRFRQFLLGGPALGKEHDAARGEDAVGVGEEVGPRSEGAG